MAHFLWSFSSCWSTQPPFHPHFRDCISLSLSPLAEVLERCRLPNAPTASPINMHPTFVQLTIFMALLSLFSSSQGS